VRTLALVTFAFSALVALGFEGVALANTASLDLLARAADPNPGLNSYIAAADLAATLHAPIPVHKSFHGTVYYLKPQRKIVFENVSGPLSQFKELTSTTPSYEGLLSAYTITPLEDDGTKSMYTLVPKKSGSRVSSIDVTVVDSTALVSRIVWKYMNGGSLSADQTYTSAGNFHVLGAEAISARFPDYNVDGTLRFSNYQLNATVDPSIFASK
jgi:hypothetical protein